MEGISRLGKNTNRLYGAFSEAEPVSFSDTGFLFWWSTNITQFLFNEEFVSND